MPEPLRILAITNTYPSPEMPGDSPCIKDQVEALRDNGHTVDLMIINRMNKLNYFKAAFQVFLLTFQRRRYDLIHGFYGHCGFIGRLQPKYPVVVTFRGSDLLGKDAKIGLMAARASQGIIVMSEEMKQASRREDARIIPFGVNTKIFHPMPKEQARQALDLPLDEKLILFPWDPAREVKRFDIIQAAFEIIQKEHAPVRLITMADKPHSVVAQYMNACDVMVLSSNYEGSPMAVREAMACDLPIVSVDVGDVRELIEPVQGCYLVERTPEAFAEKVGLVLEQGTRSQWDRANSKIDAAWSADEVQKVYDTIFAQPSRVLMLLENNPFPQDSRVRQEAAALTQVGHTVTVICPRSKGQRWRDTVNGIHVYRYPPPPEANGFIGYLIEYGYSLIMAFVLSLVAFMRQGFDVIHAHNPPDIMVLVAALYKPFGKRFVFDQHDLSPEMYYARFGGEGSSSVHRALLFFEKLSYRLADHVIATNASYQQIQMERGGVPEKRITIVRNGPDLKRLSLAEPDPDLRAKAGTIIGYVGVMGFQDGIDYLLRALHHLAYDLQRTDFYCAIMGDGDAVDSLKALATQLKLNEYVWFTGYLTGDQFVHTLSTADICVDPDPSNAYNDRSTMIKLMEYMALEKPIVAFDLPEHRVTAQDAALYAQPNDEMDFARKIAELMDDPEQRRAMGQRGRARIEAELAWSFQAEKLVTAYRHLREG